MVVAAIPITGKLPKHLVSGLCHIDEVPLVVCFETWSHYVKTNLSTLGNGDFGLGVGHIDCKRNELAGGFWS
jgi:hypothetical protein